MKTILREMIDVTNDALKISFVLRKLYRLKIHIRQQMFSGGSFLFDYETKTTIIIIQAVYQIEFT